LEGYFDFILALDMGEYDQLTAKPEPWGVLFILDHFRSETGVDFKERVIFIGDSTVDMMTARNAGIPGIQILREGRTRLSNAFRVITSLNVVNLEFTRSILQQFHGVNNH
jgi:phosphoglycolate phosphatase-like HAD superfamily hydrolase